MSCQHSQPRADERQESHDTMMDIVLGKRRQVCNTNVSVCFDIKTAANRSPSPPTNACLLWFDQYVECFKKNVDDSWVKDV